MSVFFWAIVLIAAYSARFAKKEFYDDYISYNSIQPIKGIFILLVFISHFVQYVTLKGVWDAPYFEIRKYLGQLVVVPFLFYSGYGISESIRKKGLAYVKAMPKQRIAKVLFQFGIAVILFLILRYAQGIRYDAGRVLFALIGWESIGNSNWYIFSILVMYIATWFSYFLFRKGKLAPLLCTPFLAAVYIVFIKMVSGKDECWCNTIMAYILGMWFSNFKDSVSRRMFSNNKEYYCYLGIALVSFVFLRQHWSKLLVYELVSCLFAVIMVMFTAKCKIQSKFLTYCGEHLFSLFILQRIPMIALDKSPIEKTPYLYFLVCLGLTFLFSWIFDKLTQELWVVLTAPKKTRENKQ